jgi:hypothetical protein
VESSAAIGSAGRPGTGDQSDATLCDVLAAIDAAHEGFFRSFGELLPIELMRVRNLPKVSL